MTARLAALDAPLFVIVGPCTIESRDFALETAAELKEILGRAGIPFVYKSSFDKANRTSAGSARGVGFEEGLRILADIRSAIGVPVLTDVHEVWQVAPVAEVVDVVQIPALLSRQTDLIAAAGRAKKTINIKKGQFLAPWDMKHAVEKARRSAAEAGLDPPTILVTERGTTFGYGNLVVDMRSLPLMAKDTGCPVVFDATHSVQLPSAMGDRSDGQRELAPVLARAAVATGAVAGVFMEAHPDPDSAPCDGPNMLRFDQLPRLLRELVAISSAVACAR